MALWLPREVAAQHPLAIDKMLVACGLAPSLTEARRLIHQKSIYLNNEQLIPPTPDHLPIAYAYSRYPDLYPWHEWLVPDRG